MRASSITYTETNGKAKANQAREKVMYVARALSYAMRCKLTHADLAYSPRTRVPENHLKRSYARSRLRSVCLMPLGRATTS